VALPAGPPGTAPTSPEQPWPVRTVAAKIAGWVARLGAIWVEGQVAQLAVRPGAATAFLTLRDPAADMSLSVTCPRRVVEGLRPPLAEGARVVLLGRPDFYAARGTLSLRATEIRPVGVGELLARLERLKALLAAEGLFAAERKRRLPFLPGCVGLVTGRASAAERDVRDNAARRWPAVRFRVVNVAVQGVGSAADIIAALRALDADPAVEVIVLARGGGSVEDLLPFSDEALVRAVAGCRTPVVSAVGHETDTPLVDFVADRRCSTPTDAAKAVVPDVAEELHRLQVARQRCRRAVAGRLDRETAVLDGLRRRPVLARPGLMVAERLRSVGELRERVRRCLAHRLAAGTDDLAHTRARLTALSPGGTLRRGYAVVQRAGGQVVRRPADAAPGERLRVRLADGQLFARALPTAAGDG